MTQASDSEEAGKKPSKRKPAREGRGRLSSIDMLPEEAEPDIIWALEQLRARKRTQTAILVEFNIRLAGKGIEPIPKSNFNRYAVRKAIQFRKLDEAQRMSSEVVSTLGTDMPDAVTVMVAEMIKVKTFEFLEDDKAKTSKTIMELSRALAGAVQAQRHSDEYRKQLERRVSEKVNKVADKAESIAREAGLSEERIAHLRREFLGVRPVQKGEDK